MSGKEERLHEMIEDVEDSLSSDNIESFFQKKFIDKFMKQGEEQYFSYQIQQMFRHLRRNCDWFFEKEEST